MRSMDCKTLDFSSASDPSSELCSGGVGGRIPDGIRGRLGTDDLRSGRGADAGGMGNRSMTLAGEFWFPFDLNSCLSMEVAVEGKVGNGGNAAGLPGFDFRIICLKLEPPDRLRA